jgi:hypothetical protein
MLYLNLKKTKRNNRPLLPQQEILVVVLVNLLNYNHNKKLYGTEEYF